jgi:hypothetical protein
MIHIVTHPPHKKEHFHHQWTYKFVTMMITNVVVRHHHVQCIPMMFVFKLALHRRNIYLILIQIVPMMVIVVYH